MRKLMYLCVLIICFLSCKENKSNLPSGKPKDVLTSNIYSQISKKYKIVNDFIFGYAIVKKEKYGLIDCQGKETLECLYDTIISINRDMKAIKTNDKYGIIRCNGSKITNLDYDDIKCKEGCLNNEIIALRKDKYWGVIDTNGKMILQNEYDCFSDIDSTCVVIGKNGKFGIVDSNGDFLVEIKYDAIFYNYEESNISLAKQGNFIGVINSKNKVVTDCIYNCDFLVNGTIPMVDKPQNGYIRLEKYQPDANKDVLCGLVNCETGEVAIPFEYDDLGAYSEGLIWAEKDRKCGYLDINNNVVLKFEYAKAYDFSEGLAAVEKNTGNYVNTNMGRVPERKTGFIDKYGKTVIPFMFNMQIGNSVMFKEGLAPIGISDNNIFGLKKGYINKEGLFVVKPIYDEVEPFENGVAKVVLNKKSGFVNKIGELIIPCQYNEYGSYLINDSIIKVEKDEIQYYFNLKGEPVCKPGADY